MNGTTEIVVGASRTRYVRTAAGEWNADVTTEDICQRLLDEALDDLVATRSARDGYLRQNADLIDEAIRQRDEARRVAEDREDVLRLVAALATHSSTCGLRNKQTCDCYMKDVLAAIAKAE